MEYWTKDGLSYLASAVGVPLYTDSAIENRRRINFARICMEVDASKPPVNEFEVDIYSNSDPEQVVDFKTIKVFYP